MKYRVTNFSLCLCLNTVGNILDNVHTPVGKMPNMGAVIIIQLNVEILHISYTYIFF